MINYDQLLDVLVTNALSEDIGDGDHSTLSVIPASERGKAVLKIKEAGVLAGMRVAEKVFRHLEPDIVFTPFKKSFVGEKKKDDNKKTYGREVAKRWAGKLHGDGKKQNFGRKNLKNKNKFKRR